MQKRRILFVNQEISPFSKETEISKFAHDLPEYIQSHKDKDTKEGREIRTFMPRYSYVHEIKNQLHEVIRLSGMNLIINTIDHQLIIKVGSMPKSKTQVYFVDNDEYFADRESIRDEQGVFFPDNDERMMFFNRGSLEAVRKLAWKPNLIHTNGWFASMIPFYIRRFNKEDIFFNGTKIVVSIFGSDAFDEQFSDLMEKKLRHEGATAKDRLLYGGRDYISTMRTAITYAHGIVIASPNADKQLVEYAKANKKNVLDYNPNTDEFFRQINKFYDVVIGSGKK
ncbi:MAG: glycogen/starch synthase [Bacteroidales bacterium]|nr:glycogen/starch synthase [Bacteroidales bacterium]